MAHKHFICPNCGPAGFTVDIDMKVCNCCGFTKKRNARRARKSDPTPDFLAWLSSQ